MLFQKSTIDYRNNPIMTELIEQIRREEVRNYAILTDFLAVNYSVDDHTGACFTKHRLIYAERGYKPLTSTQRSRLDKQVLAAVKALPNVKSVSKDPRAAFFRDSLREPTGKTYYFSTAYRITFREDPSTATPLKDW